MRHRLSRRGLGRKSSHRQALIRNQITELLRHDRIVTTEAKAKSVRPEAEKMITLGKRGTQYARRQAGALLTDRVILRKLFDDIAPRFETRPGGYTRITKLGPRQGDGARMAMLELVEAPPVRIPSSAAATAIAESQAPVEAEDDGPNAELSHEKGEAEAPDDAAASEENSSDDLAVSDANGDSEADEEES